MWEVQPSIHRRNVWWQFASHSFPSMFSNVKGVGVENSQESIELQQETSHTQCARSLQWRLEMVEKINICKFFYFYCKHPVIILYGYNEAYTLENVYFPGHCKDPGEKWQWGNFPLSQNVSTVSCWSFTETDYFCSGKKWTVSRKNNYQKARGDIKLEKSVKISGEWKGECVPLQKSSECVWTTDTASGRC